MLEDKIAQLNLEKALYDAIYQDYVVQGIRVQGVRTDAEYEMFCQRHPDINISRHRFTRMMCRELGLKSKQSWLDGVRGSFYE